MVWFTPTKTVVGRASGQLETHNWLSPPVTSEQYKSLILEISNLLEIEESLEVENVHENRLTQ